MLNNKSFVFLFFRFYFVYVFKNMYIKKVRQKMRHTQKNDIYLAIIR